MRAIFSIKLRHKSPQKNRLKYFNEKKDSKQGDNEREGNSVMLLFSLSECDFWVETCFSFAVVSPSEQCEEKR